jgi:hypothetical protein
MQTAQGQLIGLALHQILLVDVLEAAHYLNSS